MCLNDKNVQNKIKKYNNKKWCSQGGYVVKKQTLKFFRNSNRSECDTSKIFDSEWSRRTRLASEKRNLKYKVSYVNLKR